MNAEQKAIGCPLCGRKPSIGLGGPNNLVWYIACDEQDDHTVTVLHLGTRKDAVARWNRRIQQRSGKKEDGK